MRQNITSGLIAVIITVITFYFLNNSYKVVEEIEPIKIETPKVDQDFIDDIRGAIEEPDISPVIPEPKIAAFAGPPLIFPTIAKAKSKKYLPPPAVSKSAPNKTNKKMKSTETPIGIPKIAS